MTSRALRVLVYADLRTSHAQSWVAGLEAAGVSVRAVSSQHVVDEHATHSRPDLVSRFRHALVARGLNVKIRETLGRTSGSAASAPTAAARSTMASTDPLQVVETLLMPLRLPGQVRHLRDQARAFDADLVHALRIPYEGVIALSARLDEPVVVSSWGQDFMMQAARDPLLRVWMHRTLPGASGLHVDALADIERAHRHGFRRGKPVLHAAGNFGVDHGLFHPETHDGPITVVYPRGLRRYVNHRAFLALARDTADIAGLRLFGVGLAGDAESEAVAAGLPAGRLTLTPELERTTFAELLRTASVVVSPAMSDGTPNSLLEAFACGAYVMAGDVPSVRALDPEGAYHAAFLDPQDESAWGHHLRRVISGHDLAAAWHGNPSAVGTPYRRVANQDRVVDFYERVVASSSLG